MLVEIISKEPGILARIMCIVNGRFYFQCTNVSPCSSIRFYRSIQYLKESLYFDLRNVCCWYTASCSIVVICLMKCYVFFKKKWYSYLREEILERIRSITLNYCICMLYVHCFEKSPYNWYLYWIDYTCHANALTRNNTFDFKISSCGEW